MNKATLHESDKNHSAEKTNKEYYEDPFENMGKALYYFFTL